jgi:hypothetical protein
LNNAARDLSVAASVRNVAASELNVAARMLNTGARELNRGSLKKEGPVGSLRRALLVYFEL